jgi:hypothetical protein
LKEIGNKEKKERENKRKIMKNKQYYETKLPRKKTTRGKVDGDLPECFALQEPEGTSLLSSS